MPLSHAATVVDVGFDEPNLIADAGLVPVVALAEQVGVPGLVAEHVTIKGALMPLVGRALHAHADGRTMRRASEMAYSSPSTTGASAIRLNDERARRLRFADGRAVNPAPSGSPTHVR